ncbi:MAG: acyl-CoA dehydrogenase family protein [Pseudomonadota bacterium]
MTHPARAHLATHEVTNQPQPRDTLDLWHADAALQAAARRGCPQDAPALAAFAADLGSAEAQQDALAAQRCKPELRAFDRFGRRLDEVAFHPGYHAMMRRGAEAGYAARAWDGRPGGHMAHAAMLYLTAQIEPGVTCPLTMTYAATPALNAHAPPDLRDAWVPGLTRAAYDPASRPSPQKQALTLGMAMTEKQGGSDVRANATHARRDGEHWRLTGHKWFCSAPMCDGFLTLAQAEGGLTCFLVPRWTPEGERNGLHLQRLKDKLGNHANASAEIEYHDAFAWAVGEPGRGIPTILDMVHHTRLDTAVAPCAFMRRALDEAAWWARERTAFQRRLIDQPLMEGVLADLALDWLGATASVFRVARAFDAAAGGDADEAAFARIALPIVKFWNNKRCSGVVVEAMECLGGMGYVEETPLPMLYREAPLNGIWEGSGNVICLDVLRALSRRPESGEVLRAELAVAVGQDARYDAAWDDVDAVLSHGVAESQARAVVERLALLLQAAELMRAGPPEAAEGLLAARLAPGGGRCFGALPKGVEARRLAALI